MAPMTPFAACMQCALWPFTVYPMGGRIETTDDAKLLRGPRLEPPAPR